MYPAETGFVSVARVCDCGYMMNESAGANAPDEDTEAGNGNS